MVRVAIHQPNFFPHQNFFEKMKAVDIFVIMRHCQYEKNGYQNRFNYNNQWHTMSVNSGKEMIVLKEYLKPGKDWNRITTKLPKLKDFDDCIHKSLDFTNYCIIHRIIDKLDIDTQVELDYVSEFTGNERLLDLCKHFGATTYLSGLSGRQYLDVKLFERSGIKVEFQEYVPSKPIIDLI